VSAPTAATTATLLVCRGRAFSRALVLPAAATTAANNNNNNDNDDDNNDKEEALPARARPRPI